MVKSWIQGCLIMNGRYRRPITLYIRWLNTSTGRIHLKRRVLKNTVITFMREDIALRTGVVLRESRAFMVFGQPDLTYIPLNEWLALPESELDKYWTLDASSTGTVIVPRETDIEIPDGTNAEITNAERDLITQNVPSGRRFPWQPDSARIQGFELHLYDVSPRAAHVLIRA